MNFKSFGTHIVAGAVGGALMLGGVWYAKNYCTTCERDSATDMATAATATLPPPATAPMLPNPKVVEDLQKTSRAFVSIAKLVQPAVVNINTVQVIKTQRGGVRRGQPQLDQFFGDDFFRQFFGGNPFGQIPGTTPRQQERRGLGSGMIVDATKGLLLTNNHVIADADSIKVTLTDGRSFDAKVLGTDPQTDVAVLQIQNPPTDLTAITMGDSDATEVGDWAIAVGSPFGLSQSVTVGIISAKGRSDVSVADYENFIQTDAAINPGNSGGPLLNMRGEVIGINTAIFSRSGGYQGIGFAIPSSMAKTIMESIVDGKKIQRGYMGVRMQDLTDELAKNLGVSSTEGALVTEVLADSPSGVAGIKPGDVITQFDGKRIKSSHELRNTVGFTAVGKTVPVAVIRDGQTVELQLTLAERPADEVSSVKPADNKLGVAVAAITDELRGKYRLASTDGVVVTDVDPDGLSAKVGIQEGDVLLELNRQAITSISAFTQLADTIDPHKGLLILIERQGNRMFLAVNQ